MLGLLFQGHPGFIKELIHTLICHDCLFDGCLLIFSILQHCIFLLTSLFTSCHVTFGLPLCFPLQESNGSCIRIRVGRMPSLLWHHQVIWCHMTSSVMTSIDSGWPLSYRLQIVNNPLSPVVSEIFSIKNGHWHTWTRTMYQTPSRYTHRPYGWGMHVFCVIFSYCAVLIM